MPTTGLATLEHLLALVARDGLVEQPLLGTPVVEVVVDDVVTEGGAADRARLELGDRLAQRRRKALGIGLVRVALERRRQLQPVLDPVQAGREQGCKGQVWVRVTARDSRLGP